MAVNAKLSCALQTPNTSRRHGALLRPAIDLARSPQFVGVTFDHIRDFAFSMVATPMIDWRMAMEKPRDHAPHVTDAPCFGSAMA
jgi:hypothetical protein